MVKYDYIIKAIENTLQKHSVTLKIIRQQISPVLKSITDDETEYEFLLKTITDFYNNNYNKPKEYMKIVDNEGKEYLSEGEEGEAHSVEVPDDALKVGWEDGLYMSIHNHPKGSVSVPSISDYIVMEQNDMKYMVVVAFDGISISKNEEYPTSLFGGAIMNALHPIFQNCFQQTEQLPEFKKIQQDLGRTDITINDLDKETKLMLYNKYMKKDNNIQDTTDKFNTGFKENKVPLTVHNIPIKKVYELREGKGRP